MIRAQVALRRILPPLLVFGVLAVMASHQDDLLRRFSNQALSELQTYFREGVEVGIWLSAAYLLNRLLAVFLWDGLVRRTLGFAPPRLLRDVSGLAVYMLAITGIIGVVFQRSVAGIWATSGVLGLVLGLALRNVILDVFIGLAVNVDRPYHIGDFIMLQSGQVGRVMDINWRTTRLQTNENNTIIIPNSRIGDMVVTNFSKPGTSAEFELTFSLDYEVPSSRALRILTAGAMAVVGGGILSDPEPKARIKAISHSGVEYKVKYWIDCAQVGPGKARHLVLESILNQFHQAGIAPAQPKQDLFYAPMPARQLDSKTFEDRVELLSRIELLGTLAKDELEILADNLSLQSIARGTQLIEQGQPGESMFILIEGLLDVLIDFGGTGQTTRVGHIGAGEFLGEMSLLTGEPRTATILAATDALAYEIKKVDMDTIFKARPEVIEDIGRIVAKRRVANDAAYARATEGEKQEHEATLARQIVDKIYLFFGSVFDSRKRDADLAIPA
ncbi:MAG: mechanosensitive ion channel family protein [Chloroflexi bacterium]|nr:mechanosensitive ion channel family protein [Chloroflexota bacterium]